jgi:hypothetical protein
VKTYRVTRGGSPADKVRAAGTGEAGPSSPPVNCEGNRATPRLVACLQPAWRVAIEVVGTR